MATDPTTRPGHPGGGAPSHVSGSYVDSVDLAHATVIRVADGLTLRSTSRYREHWTQAQVALRRCSEVLRPHHLQHVGGAGPVRPQIPVQPHEPGGPFDRFLLGPHVVDRVADHF